MAKQLMFGRAKKPKHILNRIIVVHLKVAHQTFSFNQQDNTLRSLRLCMKSLNLKLPVGHQYQ